MPAAELRVLAQTLRDALAFDRPGRFPLRDPFSREIAGWGGARAPLPALDPALAAAFPGRSPRELLGALERGRGRLYEELAAYAATAGPAFERVARTGPRGPGGRVGAAGLWDCVRRRPVFYDCVADGERLQRSPWGRLKVNPAQARFLPIFRALLVRGMPAPQAMREAWGQVRRNPGATWHAEAAGEAAALAARTPWGPGRIFFHGKMRAHQESAAASRTLGLNPGAAWHAGKRRKAIRAAKAHGFWPAWRHYYDGKRDAHGESADAARALGMNPQRSFDPFDYDSPAAAKRARDAFYRELRARGVAARRSVLHGQLEKYRGLGVGGRGVRDIYYVTWADPAPPGSAVEVPWPRENPWAAWHEARVSQYRRLARAARPGSRRRRELLAMARAHRDSARASAALGVEPARIPGGRRPYNPRRFPTLKDPSRLNRRRIAEQVARVIAEMGFLRMADEFRHRPRLRERIALAMRRQVALRLGAEKADRFVDLAMLAAPPRGERNPGRRFRPETLEPKGRFDPRSFRTVAAGRARVTIGCPRGKWDPRAARCKVGTRAQRILHPRGNPLTAAEVALLRDRQEREWEAADRWRAQGKPARAEWHAGIGTGYGYAAALLPRMPGVNPEYRVTAFGERPGRRRPEGYAYQVLGPYESPTRLPGTGSFYYPHLQAAKYHAARQFLDPGIHQVKIETAGGREVSRLYRRRASRGNPPAGRYGYRIPPGAVEIYGRVGKIYATKGRGSRFPGQRFVHRFTKPARILGLPDGRLLITPVGRR